MNAKRTAVVVGVHHWHSPLQVGSHAIARELADQGWHVAYISAPITPFHLVLRDRRDVYRRWVVCRSGGVVDPDSGIWHYVPFSFVAPDHRPLLGSKAVFKRWQHLSFPSITSSLRAAGFSSVDLLLLSSHFQPFWLDALSFRRSVYRLADLTSAFPGYSRGAAAVEAHIASRVDLVATASSSLVPEAVRLGANNVFVMPNGIRFAEFSRGVVPPPEEYREMTGPIAVYVGAFGGWVDVDLIVHCARARPDMNFVLIGPSGAISQRFSNIRNVHLIGARDRAQLISYLRYAHVGLIPFDHKRFRSLVDHVHPLKLYEYLACGLPVVSTSWLELKSFSHPAMLCETNEQFVDALPQSIERSKSSDQFVQFASRSDWSFRVKNLLEKLDLH